MGDLILADFKGKTWVRDGGEPVITITPDELTTLQALAIDVMNAALSGHPYDFAQYHAPDKDPA